MLLETIDVLLILRVVATVVFVLCAALSIRLITLYRGTLLDEPWLPICFGALMLCVSEILAAWAEVSPLFTSDAAHIARSVLALFGGSFLFLGLYRARRVWRKLSQITKFVLSVPDTEG